MTETPNLPATPSRGKTEFKVKVAATVTYLAGVAAATFLATTATDYVRELPDVVEAIVYPALLAAITLVSGRAAKSKPDALAPSTLDAAKNWLRERMPQRRTTL